MRGINQGSYAISNTILHLTNQLIRFGEKNHQFYLYFNHPDTKSLFPEIQRVRSFSSSNRVFWDHVWLPYAMRKDSLDLALFMKGTTPFFVPNPTATIFHDLGYFYNDIKAYKRLETIYMKFMMRRTAKRSRHLFADSRYTKEDIIKILKVVPEKVSVNYLDCSPIFQVMEDRTFSSRFFETYSIPEKFIFSPVSLSPRKNISRILDAFETIQHRIPHDLVITGGMSWGSQDVSERIRTEFYGRVHILGEIPAEDLPKFYTLAEFSLYPSLLEGFGMPVLESFRCGCPVLTSNVTSIPEVAGEAAFYVDPYNVDEIAKGLLEMASNSELREKLIRLGFLQAEKFSWSNTAKNILSALEQCIQK